MRGISYTTPIAAIVLTSLFIGYPAEAKAPEPQDLGVVLDINSLHTFLDTSGRPIEIISDDEGGAKRTLIGLEESGASVKIEIYSAASRKLRPLEELLGIVDAAKVEAESSPKEPPLLETDPVVESGLTVDPANEQSLVPMTVIASTATTISVAWLAPERTDEFTLIVPSFLEATSDSPAFVATDLPEASDFQLTLMAAEKTDETDDSYAPVAISRSIPASTLTGEGPSSARHPRLSSPLSDPLETTEFNYRTFLPYEYISDSEEYLDRAIQGECLTFNYGPSAVDYSFIGDNREFVAPSSSVDYRTMMDATYDWGDQTFSTTKNVGDTVVWDTTLDEEVETRQADMSNMTFDPQVTDSDYASIIFHHAAVDPFCVTVLSVGAIAYEAQIDMYDDGTVIVDGYATSMPAHEGWTRSDGSSHWKNLFVTTATNLGCLLLPTLAPGCLNTLYGEANSEPCVTTSQYVDPDPELSDPWFVADLSLRESIRWSLELPADHALTLGDAKNLEYVGGWEPVSDLGGLEQATNLWLMSAVEPSDLCSIQPLAGMENLVAVSLYAGEIDDLSPLSELPDLVSLYLTSYSGSLDDLAGIDSLTQLQITSSSVPDIDALSTLTNLGNVHLFDTPVSDFSPLYSLTHLYYLGLAGTGATPTDVANLQAALGSGVFIYY